MRCHSGAGIAHRSRACARRDRRAGGRLANFSRQICFGTVVPRNERLRVACCGTEEPLGGNKAGEVYSHLARHDPMIRMLADGAYFENSVGGIKPCGF